jgi:hypothetical protein
LASLGLGYARRFSKHLGRHRGQPLNSETISDYEV